MAPERFQGAGDARADIYALGLTLYELLALRPAFEETDRASLIRQVTQEDPPRLRTAEPPTCRRDLETIIHKAIAREPGQRYATAEALADDLSRFLEGRPILARRVSPTEQALAVVQAEPVAGTAFNALAATLTTAIAITSTVAAIWLGQSRNEAIGNLNGGERGRESFFLDKEDLEAE